MLCIRKTKPNYAVNVWLTSGAVFWRVSSNTISSIYSTSKFTETLEQKHILDISEILDMLHMNSNLYCALSKYTPDKIGVYMISLDEVTPIFIQAYNHPVLSKIKWYGSDGTTLNEKLIRNHESALFALNTSFSSPIYSMQNGDHEKLEELLAEIRSHAHVTPSPYPAVAYDAFWVAALARGDSTYEAGS